MDSEWSNPSEDSVEGGLPGADVLDQSGYEYYDDYGIWVNESGEYYRVGDDGSVFGGVLEDIITGGNSSSGGNNSGGGTSTDGGGGFEVPSNWIPLETGMGGQETYWDPSTNTVQTVDRESTEQSSPPQSGGFSFELPDLAELSDLFDYVRTEKRFVNGRNGEIVERPFTWDYLGHLFETDGFNINDQGDAWKYVTEGRIKDNPTIIESLILDDLEGILDSSDNPDQFLGDAITGLDSIYRGGTGNYASDELLSGMRDVIPEDKIDDRFGERNIAADLLSDFGFESPRYEPERSSLFQWGDALWDFNTDIMELVIRQTLGSPPSQ